MKIKNIKIWSENLKLTRPYSIAYETIDSVENVFVHIQLENGTWGIGSGSPAEFVTGENILSCKNTSSRMPTSSSLQKMVSFLGIPLLWNIEISSLYKRTLLIIFNLAWV